MAATAVALTLAGTPFALLGGPLLGTPLAVMVLAALSWRIFTGPALTVPGVLALALATAAGLTTLTVYVVHPLHLA